MPVKGTVGSLKIPPLIVFVIKEGGAGAGISEADSEDLGFPD